MTGIDRLRGIGNDYVEHSWSEAGKRRGMLMLSIADQIERERACDEDAIENVRLIVGRVIDDMESHISGVEGADDSPVARWARELRRALKSDASDERGAQKPSWHDHAEGAGVTSDTQKVTRDPADDVSMSAYDLLPQEDRDAIAWVREHGGLEKISQQRRESVPRAAYERKKAGFLGHIAECETALRRRNERIAELEHERGELRESIRELGQQLSDLANEVRNQCRAFDVDVSECDTAEDMLHDMNEALSKRLMPEGMEWLLEVWPKWSNGEYCKFGDWWTADKYGETEPKPFRKLSIYTPE